MFGLNTDMNLMTHGLNDVADTSEVAEWARVEGITSKAAMDPERCLGEGHADGLFGFLSMARLQNLLRRQGRAA